MFCFASTRGPTSTWSSRRRPCSRRPSRTCGKLKASLDQAAAATEKPNAQFELAQRNYDRQAEMFQKRVIAQATLDTFTRNLETSRQSLAGARAEEGRARLASTMPRAHLGINSAVGNDLGIALRDGCKNQHTSTVLGKLDAVRQELIHRFGMQWEHVEANGLHARHRS